MQHTYESVLKTRDNEAHNSEGMNYFISLPMSFLPSEMSFPVCKWLNQLGKPLLCGERLMPSPRGGAPSAHGAHRARDGCSLTPEMSVEAAALSSDSLFFRMAHYYRRLRTDGHLGKAQNKKKYRRTNKCRVIFPLSFVTTAQEARIYIS